MLALTPPASVICDSIVVHCFFFLCFGGMPTMVYFFSRGGATSPKHVHWTDLNL